MLRPDIKHTGVLVLEFPAPGPEKQVHVIDKLSSLQQFATAPEWVRTASQLTRSQPSHSAFGEVNNSEKKEMKAQVLISAQGS